MAGEKSFSDRLKSVRGKKEKPAPPPEEDTEKPPIPPSSTLPPAGNDNANNGSSSNGNGNGNGNGKTSDKKSSHNNAFTKMFHRKEQRLAEQEAAKVDDIQKRLSEEGRPDVPKDLVREAVASQYADSCPEKAYDLVALRLKSDEGWIAPYDPNVELHGAENRSAVTCYIDSLFFAMFVKMDAYECMLKPNPTRRTEQKKLADAIRLWVNMVRLGKLVHTDMTAGLQNAMVECGWADAGELKQQDTSEAFGFITETLELPLLTLEVDLFHEGRKDEGDHKVIHERLLNVSVPVPSEVGEGREVTLEDCLEEYFNTKVDVQRDDEAAEKQQIPIEPVNPAPETDVSLCEPLRESHDNTLHASLPKPQESLPEKLPELEPVEICHSPIAADSPHHDENQEDPAPLRKFPSITSSAHQLQLLAPTGSGSGSIGDASVQGPSRPPNRPRTGSTIQRVVLDEMGQVASSADSPTLLQRAKRQGSTIVKAITVPAWQFYRLIPFSHNAPVRTEPSTDRDVVTSLSDRPVVGICLKRYLFEDGNLRKHNTVVDIPERMRLPHFISTEDDLGQQLNQNYKLVLQSVVCHRGDSMHSGHYISFARIAPKLLTDNRRHSDDPPPDYEEAQWVRFDDLIQEGRVQCVDDIKTALREESPYLVFYQIVPTSIEVSRTSFDECGSNDVPPSYDASTIAAPFSRNSQISTGSDKSDATMPVVSQQTSGYFDASEPAFQSSGPSLRFSLDQPGSRSSLFGEDGFGIPRRGSVPTLVADRTIEIPAKTTPDGTSPLETPMVGSPTSKFMAAAKKMGRSRSRGELQPAETSVNSVANSFLKAMRSGSKEGLREPASSSSTTMGVLRPGTSSTALPSPMSLDGPVDESGGASQEKLKEKEKLKDKRKGKGKKKEKEKSSAAQKGTESENGDRECVVM